MKKKLLVIFLTIAAVFCCAFGFTACHEHFYTDTVIESTCSEQGYTLRTCNCGESYKHNLTRMKEHNFVNGFCSVCKQKEPSAGLEYASYMDSYSAIIGIGTCTDTNIVIANSYDGLPVTIIDKSAFEYCSSITNIKIPDSVTCIKNWAFAGCSSLISIKIPDSVTCIDDYAFARCSGLTSIIIPNSVTSIPNDAFVDCNSLTSIIIPDSVTSIGEEAFAGCNSLTSIIFPDSVSYINDLAFGDCRSLKKITIPNSVTSIGERAYVNCSLLTNIIFNGTTNEWDMIEKGSNWDNNTGEYTVHCTDGDIDKSGNITYKN